MSFVGSRVGPDSRIKPKSENPIKKPERSGLRIFLFWHFIGSKRILDLFFVIFTGVGWSPYFCFCKIHQSGVEFGFLLWFKFSERSGLRIFYILVINQSGVEFGAMKFIWEKQTRTKLEFRIHHKICSRRRRINLIIRELTAPPGHIKILIDATWKGVGQGRELWLMARHLTLSIDKWNPVKTQIKMPRYRQSAPRTHKRKNKSNFFCSIKSEPLPAHVNQK